ncbi:UDP-4-amino-4,6-dideoxy-N-acetyl-beta-L-altrosamine transaminase [Pelagicoccus sp. SDUM812003]|uniref:UDP-4-amino-4, 6-dideoxy-N-acetyl-beta-L-altrosamine transaminase n=1 Tax=Pelagicoccus sp. SDUM812003 TaxID=3041267 RepID=UPI00280E0CCB|nr:UDP-4-amino-4,6-dideoxy-N-acetyl-beta-L-altrosamine transaminase [Pelagicoccus sp. SDUM812003]MDQ8201541.1 UDP-4-amino-4,6-dideoxy-N-acetyl-beta-L-altrosamine transaminase [Pelagicoccus sp. SDUM812003]
MTASRRGDEPSFIPYARQCIEDDDIQAVVDVLKSDFVTQGPQIERFEASLAEYTGARYAVAVSSGTAALHLSCQGLGIQAGDVGLVPAITFAATANALRYVGAEVAFVDVDDRSGLASAEQFLAAADGLAEQSEKQVWLPVSYSGLPPDLPRIAAAARERGAFVVEDAAHSIGATYPDGAGSTCRSGSCSHSDAAILSFHPVKHLCAGEGGAVLTNDQTLARRIRRLRSHGVERGRNWLYDQVELGSHYRMTELQAALGLSQLGKLDRFLERRRAIAQRYQAALERQPFAGRVAMAHRPLESAWHLFVIRFANAIEREAAYHYFREHQIGVQVHYFPVYQHSYYRNFAGGHVSLPGAEAFYAACLSLPMYPQLTDADQDRVISTLKSFLQR